MLAELLKGEGLDVEQQWGQDPTNAEGGRQKDPVSIIVASSGAAHPGSTEA